MSTLTRVFSFPNSPTELTTQVTTRIQNILQSPTISRYHVTYKLYRRGSEKLCTLHSGNSTTLYCFCGDAVYELGQEYENVLLKLKTWTLRQTVKIMGSIHLLESQKRRIGVGMISQGPSTRGLVLELSNAHDAEDEQVLMQLFGPFYQTIRNSGGMITSTGADINSDNHTGALQVALAYFDLLPKI